jgi:parallel beta-helix repeat protein
VDLTSYSIVDGFLQPNNTWIGNVSSDLQSFIDRLSPTAGDPVALSLSGSYLADLPLNIPSYFALNLHGTFAVSPGAKRGTEKYPAMLQLKGSNSKVTGSTFHASQGLQAISVNGGKNNVIQGVTATTSALIDMAAIALHGGSHHEIASCTVSGDARGIWTLATSYAYVHDNKVHNCGKHSLDFDAYTKNSVAVSNTCQGNKQEGIFLEESASGNVLFKNICQDNTGNGIGVYSNEVGPVANNAIVSNTLKNNGNAATKYSAHGISASGLAKSGDKTHISKNNVFIGNVGSGNRDGDWASGGTIKTSGDFWADNSPKVTFTTSKAPAAGVLEAATSTLSAVGAPPSDVAAFKTAISHAMTSRDASP